MKPRGKATEWMAVYAVVGCGIAVAVNVGKVPMVGIGLAVSMAATLAGLYVHDIGGLRLSRFMSGIAGTAGRQVIWLRAICLSMSEQR